MSSFIAKIHYIKERLSDFNRRFAESQKELIKRKDASLKGTSKIDRVLSYLEEKEYEDFARIQNDITAIHKMISDVFKKYTELYRGIAVKEGKADLSFLLHDLKNKSSELAQETQKLIEADDVNEFRFRVSSVETNITLFILRAERAYNEVQKHYPDLAKLMH